LQSTFLYNQLGPTLLRVPSYIWCLCQWSKIVGHSHWT